MSDGRIPLELMGSGVRLECLPAHACAQAARMLGCDGAAVTVECSGPDRVTVCATHGAVRAVEDAQETAAQGPGHDAFDRGRYTRWDLRRQGAEHDRWPLLTATSVAALAPMVVHCLPLRSASRVFGVLTLVQRGEDRVLDEREAADVAVVVGSVVLGCLTAPGAAPPLSWQQRGEVHRATGMVMAQLDLAEADALALVRAHAYSEGATVNEVSRQVLRRSLVFHRPPHGEAGST